MDRRIYSLREAMLIDLGHQWNNAEMARFCNVSISYFQRLFREQTRTTPNSFLKNARLEQAEIFLLRPDFPLLKEIGIAVGLLNYAHFARDFKKKTGLTLTEFRRRGWDKKQSIVFVMQ